jgi:hypothetical protein
MRRWTLDELKETGLPERLPANTELGVWKRSTGYEVFMPYHRSIMFWAMLLGGLVALVAVSIAAFRILPLATVTERIVLYAVTSGFILVYMGFLLYKLYETRNTRIRIDMSRQNLLITRVSPAQTLTTRIADIPVSRIEEVLIDGLRGISVSGSQADPSFGIWIGAGLPVTDLYYVALLIGRVSELPPRDAMSRNIESQVLSRL